MKSLIDYTQAEVTAVFDKHGVFFAFGKSQYEEKAVQGVTYVSMLGGACCPKENAKQFLEELNEVYRKGEKAYLAEYGLEAIIKHELANHECYYTGDWMQAFFITVTYGATKEQVLAIYQQELQHNQDF